MAKPPLPIVQRPSHPFLHPHCPLTRLVIPAQRDQVQFLLGSSLLQLLQQIKICPCHFSVPLCSSATILPTTTQTGTTRIRPNLQLKTWVPRLSHHPRSLPIWWHPKQSAIFTSLVLPLNYMGPEERRTQRSH